MNTSLTSRFSALPTAQKWQFLRSFVGISAAFAILVSGIRWYKLNYLPVADLSAGIPDAAKVGNVADSLQRSQALLDALKKVDYDPWKVPKSMLHLPDEAMSESRKQFGMTENQSSVAFPGLASSLEARESAKEIVFSNDLYVRHNAKAYNGDIVKTDATGFVIVGWKNGKVTTVPIEDVRLAILPRNQGFMQVYPGMAAYDRNGLRVPAIEFASGKNSPKFQAFLKKTLATDDTQACRAPVPKTK